MAAGDYTIYDEASSNASGNVTIVGQSAAAAAALTFYVGFNPSRVTLYKTGAAGATADDIYFMVRGLGTQCWFADESAQTLGGAATAITVAEGSDSYEGQWSVTISSGSQTNSHFYTLIIER